MSSSNRAAFGAVNLAKLSRGAEICRVSAFSTGPASFEGQEAKASSTFSSQKFTGQMEHFFFKGSKLRKYFGVGNLGEK